jgi:hypothetical protein
MTQGAEHSLSGADGQEINISSYPIRRRAYDKDSKFKLKK